ncbi:HET-domain-containing protein [Xylaria telfairii]|nr:HET-domain-containing protein [Xylaria telfairii]
MMPRCDYCAKLSISLLVDLAIVEFDSGYVPQQAFYQHHASLDDLESSAISGCDLCILIFDSFRGTPRDAPTETPTTWPKQWAGHTLQVEASMLATTRNLTATDIKIFIDTEHLYVGDTLEHVRVFDVLRIHVGPVPPPLRLMGEDEELEEDEGIWNWDPLTLVLFASPIRQPVVNGFQIGRFKSDTDLASEANFDFARRCLSACQNEHIQCLKKYTPELPTRVIDVGAKNYDQSLRLIATRGNSASYVALSHCWGGHVSPLLLSDNIDQFKNAIQFQDLPANFQDAVTITRKLDIRYLWIDSLCIVQDSKQDWQQESQKMGLYYGNSTLTIYASRAESSASGIFRRGAPPAPSVGPSPVYLDISGETGVNQQIKVELMLDDDETLTQLDLNSPLSSRGWTLQESVLAPRQLYFDKSKIYWQCLEESQSTDGLPGGCRTPFLEYPSLKQALFSNILANPMKAAVPTEGVLVDYYWLTKEYSYRQLSRASDKLPAFAGLAQRIHASIGGDYLAGLWSSDFHRGLTWYYEMLTCRHVSSYRAPSWSWGVTNERILFYEAQFKSDAFKLQLISYNLSLSDPTNPYGEIKGGYIDVRGFVKSLFRSTQWMAFGRSESDIGRAYFDDVVEDYGDKEPSHPSIICRAIINDEDCLLSVNNRRREEREDLKVHLDAVLPDKYTALLVGIAEYTPPEPPSRAACLILRELQCSEGGGFERVGFVDFWSFEPGWFSKWEERALRLF